MVCVCYLRVRCCLKVKEKVWQAGFMVDVDLDHGTTLNKKIRNAQLAQYNFIFGKHCMQLIVLLLCNCASRVC